MQLGWDACDDPKYKNNGTALVDEHKLHALPLHGFDKLAHDLVNLKMT